MRSPETSAAARSGRRELMGRNPVTPGATGPSRNPVIAVAMDPDRNPATPGDTGLSPPLSTKSRDTTCRRPSCTDQQSPTVRPFQAWFCHRLIARQAVPTCHPIGHRGSRRTRSRMPILSTRLTLLPFNSPPAIHRNSKSKTSTDFAPALITSRRAAASPLRTRSSSIRRQKAPSRRASHASSRAARWRQGKPTGAGNAAQLLRLAGLQLDRRSNLSVDGAGACRLPVAACSPQRKACRRFAARPRERATWLSAARQKCYRAPPLALPRQGVVTS